MEEQIVRAVTAEARYRAEALRCRAIFVDKNRQYGNSIEETGVLGAVVELVAKNARLRQLVLHNKGWAAGRTEGEVDAVRDTLRDLVNYGLIGLMMLEAGNWVGRESREGEGDA
jgi:hypothetical protein